MNSLTDKLSVMSAYVYPPVCLQDRSKGKEEKKEAGKEVRMSDSV